MSNLLSDLKLAISSSRRALDQAQIVSAWEFASLAHSGQKRKSGEPFIIHPTRTALTLISWGLDTEAVIAGLLHDTIEDGGATKDDLISHFGESVFRLVDGVTNISNIHLSVTKQQRFVENLRKMLLVMAKDLRVVLIKLADRLHNMQTLQYLPPDRAAIVAKETLEIYAPLAESLGMGEIKGQLEDLAFPYVYPQDYAQLSRSTKSLYAKSSRYISDFKKQLLKILTPIIPQVVVNTRQKHLYSLYKKLARPEIDQDLGKIYDLSAARILVDTVPECYLALGQIHHHFRPVPFLGIRDFIATPKPNGYRSLHTNVFGPRGRIVEIQIRTHTMHAQAEMGIAAHWHYSAQKSAAVSDAQLESGFKVPDKLSWVRQLMSWQQEITDNDAYLQTLKFDALQHRLLVFSPLGDVYDLPSGATPIDYAYAVHTQLGNRVHSARVNGKLVTLDYKLQNGDMVEIIPDKNRSVPSKKWLDFAVTTLARHQISKS